MYAENQLAIIENTSRTGVHFPCTKMLGYIPYCNVWSSSKMLWTAAAWPNRSNVKRELGFHLLQKNKKDLKQDGEAALSATWVLRSQE